MSDFAEFVAKLDGRKLTRHAVLCAPGTWGIPGTQYPADVVNGLNEYVDFQLCYAVEIPYPASFGPVGGALTSPSYQESVNVLVENVGNWITDNAAKQTFALGGYSQSAEGMSRIAMELMDGSLKSYADNWIGGFTFGNPSRGAGFHAPGIADPGGRGISPTRMTTLPARDGRVIWADYVHSKANGDPGNDMYASVPDSGVGDDMQQVYDTATALEFHDFQGFWMFCQNLWNDAAKVMDAPMDAIGAAIQGIEFVMAPGGPTAPHISYLGEIDGYSNLVAQAVGFLHDLATAVPAQSAA